MDKEQKAIMRLREGEMMSKQYYKCAFDDLLFRRQGQRCIGAVGNQ